MSEKLCVPEIFFSVVGMQIELLLKLERDEEVLNRKAIFDSTSIIFEAPFIV